MKAIVTNAAELEAFSYPKLMSAHTGCIVLFIESGCGVCVAQGNTVNTVGSFSRHWDDADFRDFHGEVTLSNEG